jgi:phenylpropionate dioxygenase-like ring-hydroxylating dioxygenase large terminal subunit
MFAKRAWYVVGRSAELGTKPMHREVLGTDIALFRDANGAAHALGALCPHRGANLGLGKVVDGALQCPFHGWRFDGAGKCTMVPSQDPASRISSKACVSVYPLIEQQGLLHAWMDSNVTPAHEPTKHDFFEPALARGRQIYDAMVYDASFLNTVENALDGAHLAFVHTGSVGPNQDPRDPPIKLALDQNRRGFTGTVTRPPAESAKPRRNYGLLGRVMGLAPTRASLFRFEMGGLVYFDTEYENDTREVVLAYITPRDANTTWFFAETIRTRGLNPIGDLLQRRFGNTLLHEDERALAKLLARARGPGGLPHPVFVAADKQTVAFRRLYAEALRNEGIDTPPWVGAELDPTDLSPAAGR